MIVRILLLATFFIASSSILMAQTASAPSGSGTSGDPYLISSLNNLYWITQNSSSWDKYFNQISNIDASASSGWDSGAGFTPIGNSTTKFTGQYDGNNKSISNLFINRSSINYIGLFGYTNDAIIKNLTLNDVNITGSVYVGAFAGELGGGQSELLNCSSSGSVTGSNTTGGLVGVTNSQITNSTSSATVSGVNTDIGGIVGLLYYGTITSTNFSGSVSGYSNVGNFAGRNERGTIEKSYAIGTASGNTAVGGFIGKHYGGTIQNNYSTGNATGTTNVGGFIGEIENPSAAITTLTKNYSIGTATGTTNVGGFLGKKTSGTVSGNYWNTTTSGTSTAVGLGTSTGVTGRTTDEMRDQAFFSDFDFINIWQLLGNANFPILQDNLQSPGPGFIITEGDGSSGDPFQVSTIEQLHAIRANLGSNYVLMNDLDLTSASGTEGGKFWNSGNGFEPMGDYGSFFTGNFDGGGFAITGLYMNRANQNYISLFGVITNSAKIQNLGLIDVNITGNYYTAGIAGSLYGYNTTVSNCFITGSITAVGNYTGGLVSTIQEGKVENNFSQLTINSSGNYVGGIVADNASGRVLKNYATGLVTADSDYNGAVIGRNNATASDNYWNTQTGGPDNGVGTGLTTEQMRQQSSFTGFDFENTWETLEDGFSYPYLQGFEYSTLPGALDESFVGRALNFSEGSLVVNDNDVFDDLGTLTIETWFYLDSNKRHGILEKHVTGESGSGWWLDINTDITALFISADGSRAANSTFIPELNTWYHLAVTYDGTTVKLYVNGEDVSSATTGSGSGTILNNTNVINAGRLNWTSSGFMDGKLDEIRIWNSVRTSDQIMENMFQKLNGDESGLIMYLPLDDAFGTSIADKSTTSNTATLDNGVSWIADTHPYGTFITGSEDWRMMSSPFGDASYGSLLDSLWTQGFPGSDSPENGASNVYFWDETAREFTSITNATDIPPQGTGFITFVYDDDNFDGTPDGFPKVIQVDSTQTSGSVSPTLSFTDSGTLANDGWNLVGNPYGATIDWDATSGLASSNLDASIYVWNNADSTYQTWNGEVGSLGDGLIAPWQGFWVKANATTPSLSLSDEARSAGGVFHKKKPVSQLGFTLTDGTLTSKSLLMFSDNASVEKDILDAYKLQSLNNYYLSLFTTIEDGSGLDINALPSSLIESISIPLDYSFSTDASPSALTEMVLSWKPKNLPDGISLTLLDNQIGIETDLTNSSSYSFDLGVKTKSATESTEELASPQHRVFSPSVLKAKTESSRFAILVNAGTSVSNEPIIDLPTTVELQQNYPNPFNPSTTIAFGLPQNGQVTLEVFDVLGRKVATLLNGQNKTAGRHTFNFDASSLSSGMYIYRLQAGNAVFTKKLTLIK